MVQLNAHVLHEILSQKKRRLATDDRNRIGDPRAVNVEGQLRILGAYQDSLVAELETFRLRLDCDGEVEASQVLPVVLEPLGAHD